MSTFSKSFILLFFFVTSVFSSECDSLKNKVLANQSLSTDEITHIRNKVSTDNICFQNLVGIMRYLGNYFPKDELKAANTFYKLSLKNYPEAQFNFAMTTTKRLDQIPDDVLTYIVGIYYKYASDGNRGISYSDNDSEISILAKNLGVKYINSLPALKKKCDVNSNCTKEIKDLNAKKIKVIEKKFYEAINNASKEIGNKRFNMAQESKEQANTIFLVLSLGAAAYSLTSSYQPYSANTQTVITDQCGGWFKCGFEWNPLDLKQF